MATYEELEAPPDYSIFQPRGIDDSGVLIGVAGNQGPTQGFIYQNGVYTSFDDPLAGTGAGQFTSPTAISGNGQVAGFFTDSGGVAHAFVYSSNTFTTLPNPLGYSAFQPNGINDSGVVVGVADNQAPTQGFVYRDGVYTPFNDPAAGSGITLPTAINDHGDITGTYTDDGGTSHAFLYSQGKFTTLPDPPGYSIFEPNGINNSGVIIGIGGNQGPSQGFVYSNGVYTPFNDPEAGGDPTFPYAINNRGDIAAGYKDTSGVSHAVVAVDYSVIPCFCSGTLIRTAVGEVPVEELKIGDELLTCDGRVAPIAWIGYRKVSKVFAGKLRSLPVRILAGALDNDVPSRDLLVSPDHAIFVGGVLVTAGALVNEASVFYDRNVPDQFTYYQIELDEHSLIFAENTPVETFVDNVDRVAFDNWSEHISLFPEGKLTGEMEYPRAKAVRQVPRATRDFLLARASLLPAVRVRSFSTR
jgi:probable HAF family extracellular repeat protein